MFQALLVLCFSYCLVAITMAFADIQCIGIVYMHLQKVWDT